MIDLAKTEQPTLQDRIIENLRAERAAMLRTLRDIDGLVRECKAHSPLMDAARSDNPKRSGVTSRVSAKNRVAVTLSKCGDAAREALRKIEAG